MNESIYSYEDLLNMLDHLLKEESHFTWDNFYKDRERKVPFFKNEPDENVANYFETKKLTPGKVLELGCGPGRNANYFAEKGCFVDAVDQSEEGLKWAKERALENNLNVNFIKRNIFELDIEEGTYDFVYDSGCFHHIAPHRRMDYLKLVKGALKPGGLFGLTCFVQGGELGGADISDWEVYRLKSLKGGLGFTEEKLREIFRDFEVIEIRKMRDVNENERLFGTSALWVALFKNL